MWGEQAVQAFFHGVFRVVNAVVPARCLGCGFVVSSEGLEPGALCPDCFRQVDFIAGTLCRRCGVPLGEAGEASLVCGRCLAFPPVFGRARSAFFYEGIGKDLILRFKHADRTDSAFVLARWMVQAGRDLLAEADLLVPVPLHWRRLFLRRYNQAALIGRAAARLSGVPHDPLRLVRTRATVSQGRMARKERLRNVEGAFGVRDPARLDGRRVVLIDDVLTSGATVSACAKALFQAGARTVDVLTLARVTSFHGARVSSSDGKQGTERASFGRFGGNQE